MSHQLKKEVLKMQKQNFLADPNILVPKYLLKCIPRFDGFTNKKVMGI